MKIFKDRFNDWIIEIGRYQFLFYKWGFGIDRKEYLPEFKKIGYKNIYRLLEG